MAVTVVTGLVAVTPFLKDRFLRRVACTLSPFVISSFILVSANDFLSSPHSLDRYVNPKPS